MNHLPGLPTADDGWTAWPPRHPAIDQSVGAAMQRGDWGRYHSPVSTRLAERLSAQFHAAAVRLTCSGTAAIELAVRLCLPPRFTTPPRVAVAAYDYPGVLRTVELAGGRPVLVDTLPDRPVMDPAALENVPGDVVAVIASDLYGHGFDPAVTQICRDRGWRLIHDACQSPVAADMAADFKTLSFGGSKPVTGGAGGALLIRDARDAAKISAIAERPSEVYPISPLAAAAVLPQLDWIEPCHQIRTATAAALDRLPWDRIGCRPLRPPRPAACYYKYPLLSVDRSAQTLAIGQLIQWGVPAGEGFRSASKLSIRRADRAGRLEHADTWSHQLVLIDGRVLLTAGGDKIIAEHLDAL